MAERAPGSGPRRRRPDWGPRFIEAYRASGIVRLSATAAGIDRDTAYKRRRRDPRFAADWAQAEQDAIDILEAEARRRALGGSDALLMFLLRGHRPALYRERVDVRLDVRREAERLAAELDGVSADELVAEAERIARAGEGR
jgi:hypothetical protein